MILTNIPRVTRNVTWNDSVSTRHSTWSTWHVHAKQKNRNEIVGVAVVANACLCAYLKVDSEKCLKVVFKWLRFEQCCWVVAHYLLNVLCSGSFLHISFACLSVKIFSIFWHASKCVNATHQQTQWTMFNATPATDPTTSALIVYFLFGALR